MPIKTLENSLFDRSLLILFLSNLLAIVIAYFEQWSLANIMWVYWGQSVIIGYFNWKRMRQLKQFSTSNFTMNDKPVPNTEKGKQKVATFFAIHYGFFHFGYLLFLMKEQSNFSLWDMIGIAICVVVFLYNHRFSYQYNLERDSHTTPNIGTMMFFPYARILPMHLTIVLGGKVAGYSMGAVILFLFLKTFADLVMHAIEHRKGWKLSQ